MEISGRTKIVGIIGDPVAHSRSPAMHNAAFRALNLDFAYVALRVQARQLGLAIDGLRALGVVGMNVTVPHKERALEFVDSVSRTGRQVGAINTILRRGGRLHGENTDVGGFLCALHEVKFRVRRARVLVVGAGGAARAVLTALAHGRAMAVTVANRTMKRATELAEHFDSPGTRVSARSLEVLHDAPLLETFDLVVNATSVGLHGQRFFPMAYAATGQRCLFFDLIYGRRTDFQLRAAAAGRPVVDGTGMLVHQGAAAFTLWTGRRAPLAVMRAALM